MIDPKNCVTLTGGLVRDPELVNDNIVKLTIGRDYAGSDSGKSASGYFDVTYYLNNDNQRNAKFVGDQVRSGNLKKGSQVAIVGRLVQERWVQDNATRSKVVIVAEGLDYAGSKASNDTGSSAPSSSGASGQAVVGDF